MLLQIENDILYMLSYRRLRPYNWERQTKKSDERFLCIKSVNMIFVSAQTNNLTLSLEIVVTAIIGRPFLFLFYTMFRKSGYFTGVEFS